jgi:hypothetical protein
MHGKAGNPSSLLVHLHGQFWTVFPDDPPNKIDGLHAGPVARDLIIKLLGSETAAQSFLAGQRDTMDAHASTHFID